MRWLWVVALGGCIFTTKMADRTRVLGTHTEGVVALAPMRVLLTITTSYGVLHITARQPRRCWRDTVRDVEHWHGKVLAVDVGAPNDDLALALIIVLDPVILVISATIAGIAIEADHPKVTRSQELVSRADIDCSLTAPHAPLELVLPSGAVLAAETDAAGALELAIPPAEPAQGTAIVRAAGREIRVVYDRDHNDPQPR